MTQLSFDGYVIPHPWGELVYIDQTEVIIAQAFGVVRDHQGRIRPGRSNIALARVVQAHHERYGVPVIAQVEIAKALKVLGVPVYAVIEAHRQPGRYLDTVEVLSQAMVVCRQQGWVVATLVSHPAQAVRVQTIAQRLQCLRHTFLAVSGPVYDPQSTQWWTRGRVRFKLHELAAWPASMWATRM